MHTWSCTSFIFSCLYKTLLWPPNTGVSCTFIQSMSDMQPYKRKMRSWGKRFLYLYFFYPTLRTGTSNNVDELRWNWLAGGRQGYTLYPRSIHGDVWPAYQQLCSCDQLLRKWLSMAHLLNTNCWQSRFTGSYNYHTDGRLFHIVNSQKKTN